MEITGINYQEPKYTLSWLGLKTLIVFIISFVLAIIAGGIDSVAIGRENSGLLSKENHELVSNSISYCFGMIFITSLTLMLIEIAFRKEINYLQYALISCALSLFYLLLLSMTEFIPFLVSYSIATLMTVGLISIFIKGITDKKKPVVLITTVLCVEYVLLYCLACISAMALLVGSLTLFALIAVAMYFTLKLKVIDNELTLK